MKVANRFYVIAGVFAAVICGSAPEAAAQEPILGCIISGTGLLRIPAPNEGCKANETPLGFNDLPLLVALRNQVAQLQSGLAAETAARGMSRRLLKFSGGSVTQFLTSSRFRRRVSETATS